MHRTNNLLHWRYISARNIFFNRNFRKELSRPELDEQKQPAGDPTQKIHAPNPSVSGRFGIGPLRVCVQRRPDRARSEVLPPCAILCPGV
jgi:hypothetical protein